MMGTFGVLLLLGLCSLSLASTYKKPKTQKCYQCSYTPQSTRVETIKVPRVVYDVIKEPAVVSETVTKMVVEQEVVPVTKVKVIQVTVSRVEVDVIKVPQQVSRVIKTPVIVKDVEQVPRIHRFPVHFTKQEAVPVTRTRKEKVLTKDEYGKPSYDFKVVTFQDVEHRVIQDTVFEAAHTSDPVIFTRQAIDTRLQVDTVFVTQQVSRVVTDTVPKETIITETVTRPVSRIVSDIVTKQVFNTRKVSREVVDEKSVKHTSPGGWDKCMGPFDAHQAREWGIDEWDCHDNCYTRVDDNGNVGRGCYKGEFGVNPNSLGCSRQGGATYCFCDGELCNHDAANV